MNKIEVAQLDVGYVVTGYDDEACKRTERACISPQDVVWNVSDLMGVDTPEPEVETQAPASALDDLMASDVLAFSTDGISPDSPVYETLTRAVADVVKREYPELADGIDRMVEARFA